MYRCQQCRTVVPAATPARMGVDRAAFAAVALARASGSVLVEVRLIHHPFRPKANFVPWLKPQERDDPGGTGPQIVHELRLCPPCAASAPPPRVVVAPASSR